MLEQLIFAGFGGQGVLSMGKFIAEAGMEEGKYVSWLPSYGPEMRGGTSNVTVVVSDEPVASTVVAEGDATVIVAMNKPSMQKFENYLVPGGLMVINSSTIDAAPARNDIDVIKIPADTLAEEMGNPKIMNMIVLGAMLKKRPIVDIEVIIGRLADVFGPQKAHLLELNRKAVERGASYI